MKTRSMKRISLVILTIALLFTTSIAATFAATDASGRDPEKDVSLTLVALENDANGVQVPGDFKPLPGIQFLIQKAVLKGGAAQGSTNPNDYEIVAGFQSKGITDSTGKITFSTDSAKNTADTVLPGQGIYLVTEIANATGTPSSSIDSKFVVNLPMLNVTGTGWQYDVTVYPKNDVSDGPDLIKEETTNSQNNMINWKYGVNVPADIKEAGQTAKGKLVITDTLDTRLTYVDGSIKGWYTDLDGVSHQLTENTHYKASYNATTHKLVITVEKPAGFNELEKALKSSQDPAGTDTPMLYFTFDTSVDIEDTTGKGPIENGGNLEYTNSDGYEYDKDIKDENKPEADVFAINIHKIDVDGESLADAKFRLYSDENLSDEITTAEVVTDADGNIFIYGIVEGVYYLSETKAPDGYNKITNPIKVTVGPETADAAYVVKTTVTNSNGFTLPLTGGAGTILFTIVGLILIGAAVTFFALSRKKALKKGSEA